MSSDSSSSSSTKVIEFQPIELSEKDKEFQFLFEQNVKLIRAAFSMTIKEDESVKLAEPASNAVRTY